MLNTIQGVKNGYSLSTLCKNAHIIALQETWIFQYEQNMLDNVNHNFASSLSAVDLDAGIVHGPIPVHQCEIVC